jgi:uncharacterized protein YlzI (FlbEa/FlbD family)
MIQLTRLNNQPIVVNSDLIKFVEQSPDTLVTLLTGEKIVVQESAETVVARIVTFRRTVLQNLTHPWDWNSSSWHTPQPSDADAPAAEQEDDHG